MPENEFEQYLNTLARSLRLSPAQRDAIAAELRDHLETRLDELAGLGVDQQQALDTAMSEFGEAHTLARALARPHKQKTRRHTMQIVTATAAVAGLAASLVLTTPSPTPKQAQPPEPRAQAVQQGDAQPDIRPVNNHAQIDHDAFALDQDLRFLAQSDTAIEQADGESLPVLTAYRLNFSYEVPRGAYRELDVLFDPYRVHVPGTSWTREVDEVLAAKATEPDAERLLFAELSTVYTPVRAGSFRVSVSLLDGTGAVIDRAEAGVQVNNWTFTNHDRNGHTLRNDLLVFTGVQDTGRIARVEISVSEEDVQLPEAWLQDNAQADVEPVQADAGDQLRDVPLETAAFTQQAEMKVLADAIAELNKSMDLHRRFFEKALADPERAGSREAVRALLKMRSLQSLRGELESRYTAYLVTVYMC